MGLFKKMKESKYVENMTVLSKTNLSLLDTLNQLQMEYSRLFDEHEKLKQEFAKLKSR